MNDSVITEDQEIPHAHTPHQVVVVVTDRERETVEQHCLHALEAKVIQGFERYWDYSQARFIYTITWPASAPIEMYGKAPFVREGGDDDAG
jgi:hypothetical protein